MKLAVKLNPAWRRAVSNTDRRTWFFRVAALRIQSGSSTWDLEIYWKRLLAFAAAVAVVGYLSLTTALWYWWERNPHNQVGWSDIALAPLDWEGLRKKRGDTAILRALEQVRAEEFVEALYGLRVGLARSPGNLAGRLALARILSGGNPAQSLSTLEAGVPYAGNDAEFFRTLFGFYAHHGAKARALEQAEALLEPTRQPALSSESRIIVQLAAAAASLDLDQATRALELLDACKPATEDDHTRRRRFQFSALLRLERFADARQMVSSSHLDMTPAEIATAEGDLALAMKDVSGYRAAVRKLLAASADQPGVYFYALRGWHDLKQVSERDSIELEFYERFSRNDAALQLLAATAANLSVPEVVRRAERVAARRQLSTFAFRVHQSEISLRANAFEEALKQVDEWEAQLDSLSPRQRFYPAFIAQLAHATVPGQDASASGLLSHLGNAQPAAQPAVFELAANTLLGAKQFSPARDVVETGLRFYPQNDGLLRLRATVANVTPTVPTGVTSISAAPAPAPIRRVEPAAAPVDEFAEDAQSSATAIASLDRWMANGESRRAADFIAYLRKREPGWLPEIRNELAVREVPLRLSLDQRPLALAAFRDLAQRAGTPRALAFKLVRDADADGDRDTAKYLVRELSRLLPNDPAVMKLTAEVEEQRF